MCHVRRSKRKEKIYAYGVPIFHPQRRYAMKWNHSIPLLLFYAYFITSSMYCWFLSFAQVLRCAHISSCSVFMFVVCKSQMIVSFQPILSLKKKKINFILNSSFFSLNFRVLSSIWIVRQINVFSLSQHNIDIECDLNIVFPFPTSDRWITEIISN